MVTYAECAREYVPGTRAPAGGVYQQCNVFGSATGVRVTLARGQTLPTAPRGFTWREIEASTEQRNDQADGAAAAE